MKQAGVKFVADGRAQNHCGRVEVYPGVEWQPGNTAKIDEKIAHFTFVDRAIAIDSGQPDERRHIGGHTHQNKFVETPNQGTADLGAECTDLRSADRSWIGSDELQIANVKQTDICETAALGAFVILRQQGSVLALRSEIRIIGDDAFVVVMEGFVVVTR